MNKIYIAYTKCPHESSDTLMVTLDKNKAINHVNAASVYYLEDSWLWVDEFKDGEDEGERIYTISGSKKPKNKEQR